MPYIFKFDSSLLPQMGISKLLVYQHICTSVFGKVFKNRVDRNKFNWFEKKKVRIFCMKR